jgi:hypothetical protein
VTDYYPVLARAAAKVNKTDIAARQELYQRASNVLVSALRSQNREISAAGLAHEQALLQSAIVKLEAELQQDASDQRSEKHKSDFGASAAAPVSISTPPPWENELGAMPKRLAALLFGIAYVTAIISACGVIYLHGLALVEANAMPYPVLVGVMAILCCLLILLSRRIVRKLRVYGRGPRRTST